MRKQLSLIIKVLLTVLFGWWIYRQVTSQGDFINAQAGSQSLIINKGFLVLAILGMPINWLLEAVKWQHLCKPYTLLSLKDAIKSILAGLSLGIVTPARIGEYGGRLLMTQGASRAGIVTATFVGSISQNIWNICVGLVLSISILPLLTESGLIINQSMLRILAISQVVVLILVFFNIDRIAKASIAIKLPQSWRQKLDRLGQVYTYSNFDLLKVLTISGLRYLFYFIQYGAIMMAFNVDLQISEILVSVGAIYLIQSMVPIPSYLSILARGELSILVWGLSGVPPFVALIASFSLWAINLIIPSIIGVYLLNKADLWSEKS